jgi:spermidine synthase
MIKNVSTVFSRTLLLCSVFVAGAVVLSVEILGTRIVAPYFGNTIYVWSALISVTVTGLALGYFIGGLWADRYPRPGLLSWVLFVSGFLIALITFIDGAVLDWAGHFGLRGGALVGALIIFLLPMTFLGMVTPVALKLRAHSLKDIGATAGSLYALSSVGSVVGALLTGFVLIPELGIDVILKLFACALIICAGLGFVVLRDVKNSALLILLIAAVLIPEARANPAVVFNRQSMLGQVKVVDKTYFRVLLVDGAVQSWVERASLQPSTRMPQLAKIIRFMRPDATDILVVGLGSGSLSTELGKLPGFSVKTVELDERVVEAARKFFAFRGGVTVADGRQFIRNADKKFDAVILDVSKGDAFPSHLFTRESFSEAKRILGKDGILMVHFGGRLQSPAVQSIYRTLKDVFPEVVTVKTDDQSTSTVVFFASLSGIDRETTRQQMRRLEEKDPKSYEYIFAHDWVGPLDGGIVLTDRYSPLETWQIKTMEDWREYARKFFRQEIGL